MLAARKAAFGIAILMTIGFVFVLAAVSQFRVRSSKSVLIPLGPEYMPESFPFAFPEPYNPKKRSLSMVEV